MSRKRKIPKRVHVNRYEGEAGKPLHPQRKSEKATARAKKAYEQATPGSESIHYGQREDYSPLRTPDVIRESNRDVQEARRNQDFQAGAWRLEEGKFGYDIASLSGLTFIESVICNKDGAGGISYCHMYLRDGRASTHITFPLRKTPNDLTTINREIDQINDLLESAVKKKEGERSSRPASSWDF